MINTHFKYGFLALCASFTCMVSAPIQAGFQFNSPVKQIEATGQLESSVALMPSEKLTPVITEDLQQPSLEIRPSKIPVVEMSEPMAPARPIIEWSDGGQPSSPDVMPDVMPGVMMVAPAQVQPETQYQYQPQFRVQPQAETYRLKQKTTAHKPSYPIGLRHHAPQSQPQKQTAPHAVTVVEQPITVPQASDLSVNQYDIAVGFGNDLPLVSALRQIVPADYTFALGAGVKAGRSVSWNGGREWPTVLNETLAPIGLFADLQGKVVKILDVNAPALSQSTIMPTHEAIDVFTLDPAEREIIDTRDFEKQAMVTMPNAPQTMTDVTPSSPPFAVKPDERNTMDRLYIAQNKRRPQILTQPAYEFDGVPQGQQPVPIQKTVSAAVPIVEPIVESVAAPVVPVEEITLAPTPLRPASKAVTSPVAPVEESVVVTSRPVDSIVLADIEKTDMKPVVQRTIAEKKSMPVTEGYALAESEQPQDNAIDNEAQELASLQPKEPQAMVKKEISPKIQKMSEPKSEVISDLPSLEAEGQWSARSGSSLKTVLESWSSLEGIDLFWSSDYDFVLVGDVNINGTFDQAVEKLLDGFSRATPKPMGRLHPNLPNGPAVLVIETRQSIK